MCNANSKKLIYLDEIEEEINLIYSEESYIHYYCLIALWNVFLSFLLIFLLIFYTALLKC